MIVGSLIFPDFWKKKTLKYHKTIKIPPWEKLERNPSGLTSHCEVYSSWRDSLPWRWTAAEFPCSELWTIGKQGQMSTRVSTQADPSITEVACRLPYRACLTAFCLDTVARLRHVLGCCHLDNSEGWDCSRLICVFGEFTCATVAGYCQMGPNERLLARFREAASRFPRELCLWSPPPAH